MKNAKKRCRLFLHSSDECKGKLMVSSLRISQRQEELKAEKVIVECLKCMRDDEGPNKINNSDDMPKKKENRGPSGKNKQKFVHSFFRSCTCVR